MFTPWNAQPIQLGPDMQSSLVNLTGLCGEIQESIINRKSTIQMRPPIPHKTRVCDARAVISYLAVKKAGYNTQKEVGDSLNVSRIAVKNSLQRGEENIDLCQQIWDKMT